VLYSNPNGLGRIIAAVAMRQDITDDQLCRDLRRIIPDYMLPTVFIREETLPKNPNGKVDKRFLAEKYVQPTA
jgi:acyl-CoA synthetase (AMP-forming)/AMP-acid ligase II